MTYLTQSIRLFLIISIPSKFYYFRPLDHMISMDCSALDFRWQCTQQKLQSICAVLTFDPEVWKKFYNRQISIKLFYLYQRFQCRDNYFFKIKFGFSLYLLLSALRKENDLLLYISDIRQIVGYRTPVFIQPFPWRLHITITFNLPNLRLWYADVVTVNSNSVKTGSRLSYFSDVKKRKRRNVVGINMIRNNRKIALKVKIVHEWCVL
jgi:hypothetical protein